jgi:hypothetical protein
LSGIKPRAAFLPNHGDFYALAIRLMVHKANGAIQREADVAEIAADLVEFLTSFDRYEFQMRLQLLLFSWRQMSKKEIAGWT